MHHCVKIDLKHRFMLSRLEYIDNPVKPEVTRSLYQHKLMIKVARGSFTQELVGRTIKLGVTSEAGCVTRYFRAYADHTVDVTVLKQFGYAAV